MRVLAAGCLCAAMAGGAPAVAGEVEDLRGQVEAQNELLRRQAEALEQMERPGPRARGRAARVKRSPVGGVSAAPAGGYREAVRRRGVLGRGVAVAEEPWGSFNFKFYTYVRYLNQKGLDDEYTDSFGRRHEVDRTAGHPAPEGEARHVRLGRGPEAQLPPLRLDGELEPGAGSAGRRGRLPPVQVRRGLQRWAAASPRSPGPASTMGNFPQWLGRRQPADRRRVLPALLHERDLGARQALRGLQLPR